MTVKKLNLYINHLWKMREYLMHIEEFDHPWYGGLKSKFNGHPEDADAMQNIWYNFINSKFKRKSQFKSAYTKELTRIGGTIKNKTKRKLNETDPS